MAANTMTISQGLRRVKKLKGRMAELTARASQVVSYESSAKPDFKFGEVRAEIATVRDELVRLEAAVARANAKATISFEEKEISLAEAIRRLQELKAEMAWVASLRLQEGTVRTPEMDYDETTGRSVRRVRETVYITELKETERVKEIESLRDRFERLNDAVETANHKTELDLGAAAA